MARDWFWLYRPSAPSVRAQTIQVLNAAHAMASRGHRVELAINPVGPTSTREVLASVGLEPVEGLRLRLLPRGGTAASVAFRLVFLAWVARTRGRGVVLARSKRYADQALRWTGGHLRLILEVHEVDSLQALEVGAPAEGIRALEARVLRGARGVVANAPGTLELLARVHQLPPAIALHNATHPSRVRRPVGPGVGVGYVGSALESKGVRELALAARRISEPLVMVGPSGSDPRVRELMALSGGRLSVEGPIPHREVPDRLAAFRALALPLSPGLFGERLTSPLKLWDYLASGVPVVGADLPSLRDAAPGAFHPYRAGDADDLARAIEEVCGEETLRARLLAAAPLRTWADRAAALEAFVEGLG
ncbi:MAG: glycosyltransferase [Deltaproteobacteria bacterium]|nr:glycosyltransferase [Deltaproteobacteria bacterium]